MTLEGWCTVHRDDVPVTPDRRCLADGQLAIPPSWSHKNARFPWPSRPEGYAYEPPAYIAEYQARESTRVRRAPVAPKTEVRTGARGACTLCSAPFVDRRSGGSPRRYCSLTCQQRAAHQRKKARRPAVAEIGERSCPRCGSVFVPEPRRHGGRTARYCSRLCRQAAWAARKEGAA